MSHYFTALLTVLLFSLSAFAQSWTQLGSGQHSMQELGPDFHVKVPVKKIEGARLVLFNHRAARQLGLEIPDDPRELERLVLENFAYMVSKDGKGDKTWMATYYQDSNGKGPGEARGDGRALWSGEMQLEQDGLRKPVDVVLKGVGQTPLAWLKHSDPGHKDGMQSMREAVHAFIMSEVNHRNELDTTIDLAVIEVPVEKRDKHSGKIEKSAITVRIGEQTRIAHLRYWSDDPARFKKIFDYVVRRSLNLSPEAVIDAKDADRYLRFLATRLADEASRYYDLHAVHSSPTAGNRTTSGATIDLGTFRYLDAHHAEYSYLFDQLKLGGAYGQVEQMKNYLKMVANYGKATGIPMPLDAAMKTFDFEFRERLTAQWLQRIGLDAETARALPRTTKLRFFDVLKSLHEATSENPIKMGDRSFRPAAYEPRRIFEGFFAIAQAANEKDARSVARSLLLSDRSWAKNVNWDNPTYRERVQKHSELLVELARVVAHDVPALESRLPEFRRQAELIHARKRPGLGAEFVRQHEDPIFDRIQQGRESFASLSKSAIGVVPHLTDAALLTNEVTNLGRHERVGLYTGTFDPPHRGHRDLLERVKKAYGLTTLYVLVNPESSHKQGVTPFELRRELAEAAFRSIPGVVVADRDLSAAFLRADVDGALRVIEGRHSWAEIYQVMGDDSFERFQKAGARVRPHVQLVVSPRSASGSANLPTTSGLSTVQLLPFANNDISSTALRQRLATGAATPELDPEVRRLIETKSLYGIGTSAPARAGGGATRGGSCSRVFILSGAL